MTHMLETWTRQTLYLIINEGQHSYIANNHQSLSSDFSFNGMARDTHHKIWALITVCYDIIPGYAVKQYCPIPHITEI
jgi:hypothetical protein